MIESSKLGGYLDILQIFRGLAALMVIVHHTLNSIHYYHDVDSLWLNYIQALGKYGVDFFFVLSGFIISYTAYLKKSYPDIMGNYLKNRLIRIYVPYLPVGILMYILYTYIPQLSNSSREISEITTFTLFPHGTPALSVAWTLSFEIIFYILFASYFINDKLWKFICILWTCLVIYFNCLSPEFPSWPIAAHFASLYNLEFILGTTLTYFLIRLKRANVLLITILTAISFCSFLIYLFLKLHILPFLSNFLFCIFSFFLIYLSVGYKNISINKTNIFMLIGNATFSIYLTHNFIQSTIVKFFPSIQIEVRVLTMLTLAIAVSCLAGYLYYRIFEVWASRGLKKIL